MCEHCNPTRPPCPRCLLGIDSNGDGDCAVCHNKSDAEVAEMQAAWAKD